MSRMAGATPRSRVSGFLISPLRDYVSALDACLTKGSPAYIGIIVLSCTASWWLYVPVHELLHAFGCLAAGGKVSMLDIADIYGAALLKHVFPFVSVGSEYSGRLAGFDTGGKDYVYFLTDFSPYLLTIFLGIYASYTCRRGMTKKGKDSRYKRLLQKKKAGFARLSK